MEAEELRIGNMALCYDLPIIVYKEVIGGWNTYKESLNPISLTEEWLIKFEQIKKVEGIGHPEFFWIGEVAQWHKGHIKICANGGFDFSFSYVRIDTVQYVHQLQNLYFALTGEELKLK